MYTSTDGAAPGEVTGVGAPGGWYSPCFSKAQRITFLISPPGCPSKPRVPASPFIMAVAKTSGRGVGVIGDVARDAMPPTIRYMTYLAAQLCVGKSPESPPIAW